MLAVIGEKSLAEGVRLTAAHLDAPRVDIRTVPLYEDNGMAFFKTHYYGGIKKYQWTTIPLELRGVVCVCDKGEVKRVEVRVGDKPGDPKFVITDLLPHLAANQMSRKATEIVKGEGLNILVGSVPSETVDEKCSEKIKLAVMEHLNREYGMTEADFLSAELCCVPAFGACDIGFDRSFVGAYGHDDRVCSYPAATSLFDLTETPAHTGVCLLVDKEEIGSDGVTGMQSRAFETFMGDLCRAQDVLLDECFENSVCLSADVCNAFDPNYPEVSEKRNDARANCGFALVKYTGARGKSGTSDATAELMARIRCIFDKAGIIWQTGQLGRVDPGRRRNGRDVPRKPQHRYRRRRRSGPVHARSVRVHRQARPLYGLQGLRRILQGLKPIIAGRALSCAGKLTKPKPSHNAKGEHRFFICALLPFFSRVSRMRLPSLPCPERAEKLTSRDRASPPG